MIDPRLESGSAGLNISLKNGIVKVTHPESGELLFETYCGNGGWNEIWNTLYNLDHYCMNGELEE